MATLIMAGEAVFLLPFVVARIFRPTLLAVLDINNYELGSAFSMYGTVAMISYLAGGPLADRYSARGLLSVALIVTSLGGIFYASEPSLNVLIVLYGFWGVSTILIFWAALIRATREWGGSMSQGRAFGILDGGRGLFAAILASFSVFLFDWFLEVDAEVATFHQLSTALKNIIWLFTAIVFLSAGLVWWMIPDSHIEQRAKQHPEKLFHGIREVVKRPVIWLQAIIILCAYTGYKITDDFSLYAYDAFGYDDVEAATIGTISFWMRPIGAIFAGWLADATKSSWIGMGSFLLMLAGCLMVALGWVPDGYYWVLVMTLATSSIGIYALRGVYYALFQEARVPFALTGTAVGLVSVIGYTPDIFMGPLMGHLIDRSPGALGHQHVFALVAVFAFLGLLASAAFERVARTRKYDRK